MKVNDDTGEYINIKRDARQDCAVSPELFNIYGEIIVRNLEEIESMKTGLYNYNKLRDADDAILIASTNEDLYRITDTISRKSLKMILSSNFKKSECTNISQN